MCGIVGGITTRPISKILIEGLKRLEYRGYDSAGITLLPQQDAAMRTYKVLGKVHALNNRITHEQESSCLGIAHTRWATHGAPAEHNAHPHQSQDRLSIVHNGIIENHSALRQELIALGYPFSSDTDSEVIVHLLHHHLKQQPDLIQALALTCERLEGAYALAILDQQAPDTLYAARHGSPLVVGCGFDENYIASDATALLPVTQTFMYLEEGDFARIQKNEIAVYDAHLNSVQRAVHETALQASMTEKGDHRHYMIKEIHEQPQIVTDTLASALHNNRITSSAFGHAAESLFPQIKRIHIVACGTSLHAAAVAQHWLESLAQLPCHIDIASEHRYRSRVVEDDTLFIALSQSGETADTLAALRQAKQGQYLATLGICNVPESSLVREADLVFLTRAGIEIGVAATKTFTAQLIALASLSVAIAQSQGRVIADLEQIMIALHHLPTEINQLLTTEPQIEQLAKQFIDKNHTLFLGRGQHYGIAQEGALKMKEISYIHAESYAAGELKHGPLALIDNDMPVVVIAPNNDLIDKVISNIKEVQARGGQLIIFSDHSIDTTHDDNITVINMPHTNAFTSPILYNIPLQLLAYHVAILKGTDIDQPRNLAKSVTVE